MSRKLARLVEVARREARLTNVVQYVDEELLGLAFRSLKREGAPGIDGQRYAEYEANLAENLREVHTRLKSGGYRAPAVRRVYIPKGNGKQRPLGIPTLEDRMVQKAVAWVLSAVYENDFLGCSHGFRPHRSAHTALHRLREGMMRHRVKWVVEADIVGYFDHVNHAWLREFVRHRVNDGGLIRLMGRWLNAGVMEQGVVTRGGTDGTPQGGPVSPVLANIYLHYVLDLWFEKRFRRSCRGYAELTRYADDFVAVFEDEGEARRFRQEMEERLGAFGLQVAEEKTAIVPFDRSEWKGKRRGAEARSGSFAFLGFTHFLMETRRGSVIVGRTPSVQSRERFLKRVSEWLRVHVHEPERAQQAQLARALRGYDEYFGLRLCWNHLHGVRERVRRLWWQALRRRSQRARRTCNWATLPTKPWFQLPAPRITHAAV